VIETHNNSSRRISDKTAFFSAWRSERMQPTETLFSSLPTNAPKTTSQGGSDENGSKFDQQLAQLNKELTAMGALCEQAIAASPWRF
jgi:hypothetical protein